MVLPSIGFLLPVQIALHDLGIVRHADVIGKVEVPHREKQTKRISALLYMFDSNVRRHAVAACAAIALGWAHIDIVHADRFLTAEESDPRVLGWMQGFPPPPDKLIVQPDSNYFSFPKLRWTVGQDGEHGEVFGYRTVNSDGLGWVISRVTGQAITVLQSERLWRRMGAEQDAYMTVDGKGTPFAGGGLSAGLRDLGCALLSRPTGCRGRGRDVAVSRCDD